MRRLSFYLLAFLLFVSNSFAFYQFFESYQQDPASRALGQAEILTTQGGNAIFSNPANLMGVSGLTFTFGGYGVNDSEPELKNTSTINTIFSYNNGIRFSHAAVAVPVRKAGNQFQFVFAGGYQRYFDWNMQTIGSRTFSEHGANMLGVGASAIYDNRISVGVALVRSLPGAEVYMPRYSSYAKEDIKYSMTILNLGARVNVSERLSFGILFRPSYKMTMEDYATYIEYPSPTTVSYDDVAYTMPSVIGLAFCGDVLPTLTVHGEVQTRDWSQFRYEAWGIEVDDDLNMGTAYRLGIEWRGPVTLRGGIYNTAINLDDETADGTPKTRTGLTFGAGFSYRQFGFDPYLNYEWVKYGTEPISTPIYDEEDDKISSTITVGLGITFVKP